jgi:hypothetical protein
MPHSLYTNVFQSAKFGMGIEIDIEGYIECCCELRYQVKYAVNTEWDKKTGALRLKRDKDGTRKAGN